MQLVDLGFLQLHPFLLFPELLLLLIQGHGLFLRCFLSLQHAVLEIGHFLTTVLDLLIEIVFRL